MTGPHTICSHALVLKQSSLLDLTNKGVGGTKLLTNATVSSKDLPPPPFKVTKPPATSSLSASTGGFGGAGIFTAAPEEATSTSPTQANQKPEGKKGGRGRGRRNQKNKGKGNGYQPVEVPAHEELM